VQRDPDLQRDPPLDHAIGNAEPFPTQLRAGRVKYYGSIPTSITGTYPNFGNTDQRFWVECINYMLGFYQTGSSSYTDVSAMAGYGSDFTWGPCKGRLFPR